VVSRKARLVPLSQDPEKRANQLANLKTTSAIKHGARSEERVRPLRERHVAELAKAFPSATELEVAIQAHRLAQLDLLGAFMDERGVIRHKRRGEVFPAAGLMEKIATSFERQQAILLERERTKGAPPAQALESILAELTSGENGEQS
jgi:hypothetical protein